MKAKKQAAVVIPFYKPELTRFEEISLRQCLSILSAHPIIIIKPESLDLSHQPFINKVTDVISFNDFYFQGIQGYNRLMLSPQFYDKFLSYEFILIYQLDAFVFRDELAYWCSKNYDYIGAPWLKRLANPDFVKEWKTRLNTRYHIFVNTLKNGIPSDRQFDNMVGNGGFSLRRVKRLYELSVKLAPQIEAYHQRDEHQYHEDVFWSIEANRKWRRLKIPLYKTALLFSFENRLKQSMMHNGNRLPFGCHAWDQHVKFWAPFFLEYGYDIHGSL